MDLQAESQTAKKGFLGPAVQLAAHDWAVLPCESRGKAPLIEGGFKSASTDLDLVRDWGRKWPDANIGIALPEGYFVVDVDDPEAMGWFKANDIDLPATLKVRTGRGFHLYFKSDKPIAQTRIAPGIETRVNSLGYVLAPGSVHENGTVYRVESGRFSAIAEAPQALVDRCVKPKPVEVADDADHQITAGDRNRTLTSLAGSMRRRGMTPEAIEAALLQDNQARCRPPLLETEVRRIARSVSRYEPAPDPDVDQSIQVEQPLVQPKEWPQLAPEALHGVVGDFVREIGPHTEADPAAITVQTLVMCGNMLGRQPYFVVEDDFHHLNLFAVIVGESAKSRKGTSEARVRRPLADVDPDWERERVQTGLSSGEGLIYAVRDPLFREDKDGPKCIDPGVKDKRLQVVEDEFASTLRVMGRDGNTLSPIIRRAWDRGNLRSLTKNSPAAATGAHISIVGHITRDELLRYLTATEAANGFGNRFLWLLVRRSKLLPEGGAFHTVDQGPILRALRRAVDFARTCGELRKDDEAREMWIAVYPELSSGKPGLLGSMISRAEAQTLRLAALYAVLDTSELIRRPHLEAALAVWDYAEASARYIFGDALGDPVADEILGALRRSPEGMSRTDIQSLFGRNRKVAELNRALQLLYDKDLAIFAKVITGGRPAEVWRAK